MQSIMYGFPVFLLRSTTSMPQQCPYDSPGSLLPFVHALLPLQDSQGIMLDVAERQNTRLPYVLDAYPAKVRDAAAVLDGNTTQNDATGRQREQDEGQAMELQPPIGTG